ncbi:hypothetical protein LCGC14_3070280, partial [marine sediment metagenome]
MRSRSVRRPVNFGPTLRMVVVTTIGAFSSQSNRPSGSRGLNRLSAMAY